MTSSYGLEGRAAVVTGGTRGIGRAVAQVLGAAGTPTLREFGRLDALINNAATSRPNRPLMDVDPEAWRDAFTPSVEVPLRLVQCARWGWMREHGGAVVNICAEGAGHVGLHVGAYGTSRPRCSTSSSSSRASSRPGCGSTPSPPASSARTWPGSCGRPAKRRSPRGCPRVHRGARGRRAGGAVAGIGRGHWCRRSSRPRGRP